MGIMSSTDLKPESKSENNQVSSKSKAVKGRLHVFMKEGGCEESYTACVGCDAQKDECREAFSMLEKCMKARSDYFEPYLALENARAEVMLREIDAFLHAKPKDRDEMFTKFMIRGDCKEAFMAWNDFCKEAKKNNKSCLHTPTMDTLFKCMKAHSDYYHPLLTVFKTAEEHFKKEIKALNTREGAEADAKG
ncbi:unnamed protein product [Arabidopsis arenosa]|uniref:GCK domain-containing protein n=1 Tax=Arabidopsis arenosa TaxID=38785 RepID=A0A8S1ZEZ6_ARAAE|nr:unnamed protein product [Arabidopsis arenosa]